MALIQRIGREMLRRLQIELFAFRKAEGQKGSSPAADGGLLKVVPVGQEVFERTEQIGTESAAIGVGGFNGTLLEELDQKDLG